MRRTTRFLLLFIGAAATLGACRPPDDLERRFPAHAARVTGALGNAPFLATPAGFVLEPGGLRPRLTAHLPLQPEEGISFQLAEGFELQIYEEGLRRLEGGAARQRGSRVDIVDRFGRARMTVDAPEAFDSAGLPVPVRLEGAGDTLALYAPDVSGLLLIDPTWSVAGSMAQARESLTLTVLSNGKILAAGGTNGTTALASCELYDPATGQWTPTGSLNNPRAFHSAVLLRNGRVLVIAGRDTIGATTTSELYDPTTGTWTLTAGSLPAGRERFTATLLHDGRVLIAGDFNATAAAAAHLYDPVTQLWSATGSLNSGRGAHAAVRLEDGRVLVAGGSRDLAWLDTAEIYNPATGLWTLTTGVMGTARSHHSLNRLIDGTVLVAGGQIDNAGTATSSTETFNPATGLWTAAASLPTVRHSHIALLLQDGRVFTAGGCGSFGCPAVANTELYDPATRTWAAGTALPGGVRKRAAATILPTGMVLIAGGAANTGTPPQLATADLYDPSTPAWTPGASDVLRDRPLAVLLPSGLLLMAGGPPTTETLSALYDPTANTWTPTGPLNEGRFWGVGTLLLNGTVLFAGGLNGAGTTLASAELFNPATNTWTLTGSMAGIRRSFAAALLPDGRVLVTGGLATATGRVATAELYNPATGTWAAAAPMAAARSGHSLVLMPNGRVLASDGYPNVRQAEEYDPIANVWTPRPDMGSGHVEGLAQLLPSGGVLVASGCCAVTSASELFNPATGTWAGSGALPLTTMNARWALLPNGKVLLPGGDPNSTVGQTGSETYDPAEATWRALPPLVTGRHFHTTNTLPNNRVLVYGGQPVAAETSGELLDLGFNVAAAAQPVISGALPDAAPGGTFTVNGTRLTGAAEAGGGGMGHGSSEQPLFQLTRQDNGQLLYAEVTGWSATSLVVNLPTGLHAGHHWGRVISNGVFSQARPILITPPGSAAKVAFITQPGNASVGAPLTPAVQVAVQNASGATQTGSTAQITLALGSNPGGGSLSGTLTVAALNGVATFAGLSVDKAGVGYALRASASGLASGTSSVFDVAAGPASRLVFITPQRAVFAGKCSAVVTVQVQDAAGNPSTLTGALDLSFSMPGAQLFEDGACVTPAGAGALGPGVPQASVYFRGDQPGQVTLDAAAPGLTPASQLHTLLRPTMIVAPAAASARCGAAFRYSPVVIGETLGAWSLSGAPDGMTVDASTGEVRWTPSPEQVGSHTATVVAEAGGATTQQSFSVDVACEALGNYKVGCACGSGDPGAFSLFAFAALGLLLVHVQRLRG